MSDSTSPITAGRDVILECRSGTVPGLRVAIAPGGARTFRLRRDGADAGTVTLAWTDGRLQLANRSTRTVTVNGLKVSEAVLIQGDRVAIGGDVFIVHLPKDPELEDLGGLEVIEPGQVKDPATEIRRRRALSASATAVSAQKPSLLPRVSAALVSRQDRQRHDQLLRERRELLEEAGRLALSGDHLGLPVEKIGRLRAGESITLRPEDVNRAVLDRWHQLTTRQSLVEAELTTLRRVLRLGPEQPNHAVSGRIELREREEKVYAELDSHGTQELAALDGDTVVAPLDVPSGLKVSAKNVRR